MPTADPFAQYAVTGSSTPLPSTSSADPFAQYAVGGSSPSPSPASPTDPFAQYAVGGSSPSPVSGQPDDSPWYKRAWTWANKPLLDIDDTLGRTGQAGGFEKGVNDLVSGLTSPLSLALTIGTLGAGGLAEAGGASVLREAGLAGDAINDVTKGARIVQDAQKAGRTFEEGLAAAQGAGIDASTLTQGLNALKDAGLDSDALLSNGLIRRGGAAALRRIGVGTAQAEKVATGLQTMVNAGFTVQNAYQAAEMSPKVLDALKEGDYDNAMRLAVDAVGSAGFAGLGAREFAKESGALRQSAQEKLGLSVRPTEENQTLRSIVAGPYDREVATASRANDLWASDLRSQFPKMRPLQLERIKYLVESGMDEDTMARRYNMLSENADRLDRIDVPESDGPVSSGMSAERLREIADEHPLADKPKTYIDQLLATYDPRKLTDTDRQVAKAIIEKHNETLTAGQSADVLGTGVANYSTNLWKPEDQDNAVVNRIRNDANNGYLNTSTSMARSRMFDSAFEGQMLGKELEETDPIALAAHNANTFARIIAGRDAVARLLDTDTRGRDGLPLAALTGTGQVLGGDEAGAVLVNPDNVRSIRIPDTTVTTLRDSGDLDRLLQQGKIKDLTQRVTPQNIQQQIDLLEKRAVGSPIQFDENGDVPLRKMITALTAVRDGKLPEGTSAAEVLDAINAERPQLYGWNLGSHQVVDHPALHDWKHVATTPSGDSVLVKGDVAVHPEAAEYLRRILGVDDQGIGAGKIGSAVQKINREGKGILLFGSPFHVFQEGLRGLMTGVSPFGIERWDLTNDPELARGVEHGLTLGKDRRNLSAFKDGELEGNSAVLSKIPGLSQVQHGLDHFLFDKYVPSLKVRAYRRLNAAYAEAYPDWTPEKVSQVAAADTNERFGGINYRQIGRAAATQNWAKTLALAPDWLESEVRAIARPLGSEGKVARADMTKAAVGLWATARVLNYLVSGQAHLEAPFGVSYTDENGKEKVYSIRTLPTDMLHAVSDPYGFIHGRFSPLVQAGTQFVTGRDAQGRKLQQSGIAADLLRTVSPIPVQTFAQAATGSTPDVSNGDQAAKALGLTVLPYRSEALKLAAKLASDRSPQGPVDADKLKRHQQLLLLEDRLRSGKIPADSVSRLQSAGEISMDEAKSILRNLRQTKDMSLEQAALVTRASRLPATDLLKVYDVATPDEQADLRPLVQKRWQRYLTHPVTAMTQQERPRDPVLARPNGFVPLLSGE